MRWTLLATILASSMAFIDGSALNVVLSTLQENLGASGAELLWIVNGYLLMLASLILVGGALGDRYGRNRIFGAGIVIFALSSLACGLAPTPSLLILARVVQGVGGALMVPGSLAIITATVSEAQRGHAIGLWSSASTITTIAGPVLGGLLASGGLWRAVFFINLPLAVVALWALRKVPETRDENAPRALDLPGAAAIILGLGGLTYGLITLGERGIEAGMRDAGILIALAVGVLGLIAFVVIEARSTHPMVNLKLFSNRDFSGTNLMTAFLYGALSGALFFLPLLLIQVQGYDPSAAGFVMLPFAVLLALISPWAGDWGARVGPRLPLTIGPLLVGAGFIALALVGKTQGAGDYFTTYLPGILLIGAGMGLLVAPLVNTVMSSVPSSQAGIASGVNNAVTRSAQALCTALFGALALILFSSGLNGRLEALPLEPDIRAAVMADAGDLAETSIPEGLPVEQAAPIDAAIDEAFISVFQTLMLIAAGLCVVSAGMSAAVLRGKPHPSAAT